MFEFVDGRTSSDLFSDLRRVTDGDATIKEADLKKSVRRVLRITLCGNAWLTHQAVKVATSPELKAHVVLCDLRALFWCRHCNRHFEDERELALHLVAAHMGEPLSCPLCTCRFDGDNPTTVQAAVQAHLARHVSEILRASGLPKVLPISKAEAVVETERGRKHFSSAAGSQTLRCVCCLDRPGFSTFKAWREHLEEHSQQPQIPEHPLVKMLLEAAKAVLKQRLRSGGSGDADGDEDGCFLGDDDDDEDYVVEEDGEAGESDDEYEEEDAEEEEEAAGQVEEKKGAAPPPPPPLPPPAPPVLLPARAPPPVSRGRTRTASASPPKKRPLEPEGPSSPQRRRTASESPSKKARKEPPGLWSYLGA